MYDSSVSQAKPDTRMSSSKIRDSIWEALDSFFADMDGHETNNLYNMVLGEVEKPLLERVLRHTRGNQTRASELLGINRGTLRKKLRTYGLD
ncbi:MAG: DNA-binding transcriptional regulator Fis [Gammaproteobacteria bacterium]|nr:DNA-binding transcriptional regulator Fis [Gammaproteobacteria bacterium]MDH5728354.1 DNA-binding transcriptional regulator Fis [Gammaproteobacteria bacterium]